MEEENKNTTFKFELKDLNYTELIESYSDVVDFIDYLDNLIIDAQAPVEEEKKE